jgi:ubiquitin-conjugating enzyme E2 D
MSSKRLMKEMKDIQNSTTGEFTASFVNNDPSKWKATMRGPTKTPYEGGVFELSLNFPSNYPFQPPNARFVTKIFHPNISNNGSICLDILKDQWSPALQTEQVLLSLSSLLADPNADDPLDSSAANLYKNDRPKYDAKVKQYVNDYASEKK